MQELCYQLRRERQEKAGLVMLNREEFRKIMENEIFMKVLAEPDYRELNISKSYYYYVLERLGKDKLVEDGKVNFKVAVSYEFDYRNETLKLDPLYLMVRRDVVHLIDLRRDCRIDYALLAELGFSEDRSPSLCRKVRRALCEEIKQYFKGAILAF
ncbi:hypothetical protein IC006_0608 [Sulfuracidifex tepidarius]|uniref:Uncharacterized protein n=1 Tax=Sulfuracidifex tepidarius TaxID=1294262 RepID=A0A510DT41_9CREN|nr:hypothetical protein [Sulfuracidifex tepidarius]BBG23324.1 hypothetical protein IC006_0608 [Sulfuracidifex tepidarius]